MTDARADLPPFSSTAAAPVSAPADTPGAAAGTAGAAGPGAAPQRSIALDGASNFRDLGGYTGHEGRALQWRKLFRADHLATLSAHDLQVLGQLGIARTADFRGAHERGALPYALPGVATHTLGIEPTVIQRALQLQASGQRITAQQAVGLMQDTYRGFINDNAARFSELFELLLDSDAPIVFHCTAGKDRTGFAAALILLALGVPRPVVMQDYLLTNDLYRRPSGVASPAPKEVLEVLWGVQEEFLDVALHGVEVEHGGIDNYLERVLRINPAARARLAQLYLQPR